jgi:hypothetical protein
MNLFLCLVAPVPPPVPDAPSAPTEALASGGEEEVVDTELNGHSPFTYHLLRQLEAAKGEIPAREMLLSIRDKVSKSSDGQVPAYGIILSSGHASGGEYLLNPATN